MSARESLRKLFYDRLLTQLAGEYGSDVVIAFENQNFNQPKAAPWVLASVNYAASMKPSIGTSLQKFVRHTGFLIIDVFAPEKSGMYALNNIAEAVERVFAEDNYGLVDGSYLTLLVPKMVQGLPQQGFKMCTVMVPFWLDTQGA